MCGNINAVLLVACKDYFSIAVRFKTHALLPEFLF